MPELLPPQSGILDPTNPLSYAFGGGTSATPQSLAELQRRRAVAMALASQKRGFPKNIGEGLTSLGEAVGDRLADNRLNTAEAAYNARTAAAGNAAAGAAGIGVPAPAAVPAPAPVPRPPTVPGVPGPRTDAEDPMAHRQNIAALIAGGPEGRQENFTEAGVVPPQTGSPASDDDGLWSARSAAIGGIESGGRKDPYSTVGIQTKYGPALGKYGIVAANVGPWSAAALGKPLTPQEFLADPQAQDAVFKHRFGTYVAKFGEEGAARAWYGGPGNINKTNLMDDHQRLTIGGYGQDYLKRLQGAATATSGTSGGGDAGGTMTIDSATGVEPENPPTPTTIQPMNTGGDAPAGGLGRIPGAFDPRKPEPAGPKSGLPDPNPDTATFRPKPMLPSRDGEKMTPAEIEGYKLIKQFGDDPRMVQQGQMLMQFGKQQRDAAYAVKKDVFDKDMAAWEAQDAADRAYRRQKPKLDFELEDAKQKAQQAAQDRTEFPLGSPKEHQAVVKDSYEQVKNIPKAQAAINRVRELMTTDGGMFTGTGANIKMSLAKMAQAVGAPYDPKASNSETFKGIIVPIMAALRPAVVGSGPQAVFEAKALQDAAAGNVSLEPRTILNILGELEKTGVQDAVNHQRTLIANAGSGPRAETMRQLWANSYPLPMEKLVPRGAVAALRQEIEGKSPEQVAAEIKDFDATYHTPGLANKLLGR